MSLPQRAKRKPKFFVKLVVNGCWYTESDDKVSTTIYMAYTRGQDSTGRYIMGTAKSGSCHAESNHFHAAYNLFRQTIST